MQKRELFLISLAIGVFCLLYPLIFYNYSDIRAGDLAEYINNPLRVLDGKMPYLDFWLIFPPLEVYYPALLYLIFGVKMWVLFVSSWVFGAGCTILAFLIAFRFTNSKTWSVITAGVFFFSGFISHYSGFDYGGHIHLFFLLLATYMFTRKPNLNRIALLTIGLLIGIGAGFRIDLCGAYFLAICGTLIYMQKSKVIDSEKAWKYLGFISLGCTIVFVLIYLPFINMIPTVITETLIKPPIHATAGQVGPLETTIALVKQVSEGGLVHVGMTLFRLVYDVIYKLLPLATLALFIVFIRNQKSKRKVEIVLLMLWALFTLPKSLAVIDVHYLSSINGILLLPFMILFKTEIMKEKINKTIKWIGIFAIFILLVSVPASRAVDFVGFASSSTYKVTGEVDSIYLKDQKQAEQLQAVINSVELHTSLGEEIFVAPFFAPPIYEMTGRKNVAYYDSVIDMGFVPSTEKQEGICDTLINKKVKLVVYGKECQFYWDNKCMEEGFKLLDNCIEENYYKESDFGPYSVYIKK